MYKKYVELRNNKGVTDYEVAKQTGVTTSTLTNWKYGRYKPKVEKLKALADYFGVSVEYLISDDTTEQEPERKEGEKNAEKDLSGTCSDKKRTPSYSE